MYLLCIKYLKIKKKQVCLHLTVGVEALGEKKGVLEIATQPASWHLHDSHFLFSDPTLGLLNGNGPLGGAGDAPMDSMNMELTSAVTSGGLGPFAFGLNRFASTQGPGPMDHSDVGQGPQQRSNSASKEQEVITVASMQTPCRCTNSYAYL